MSLPSTSPTSVTPGTPGPAGPSAADRRAPGDPAGGTGRSRRWRTGATARRSVTGRRAAPYLLLAPALITFLVFKAYPILDSLRISTTTGAGAATRGAGTSNYQRLIHDPLFWTALRNTAEILVVQVPLMLALALLLALAINSTFVKWRAIWRLGVFMPAVTGLVATGVMFGFILDKNYGALNWLLDTVGLGKVDWLGTGSGARFAVVLVLTWHYTGYNAVIYLAGLQGVPRDLYEAAMVDGAGPVRRFRSITVPALRPIILFTVVLSSIGTLQLFDEPFILTRGGPDNATLTVSMYLYENGFHYFDFGYASAIAYALTLLVVILGVVQMRLMGDRDS